MSESQPDPDLAGPGKTADQFSPGDESPGTTYGSPTGTGGAERESADAAGDADAGQPAEGDVEGD
jgi:hypothetical protein